MRTWGRNKRSILCGLGVAAGILALIMMNGQFQKLEVMTEKEDNQPASLIPIVEDKGNGLDIRKLYTYHASELSEENIDGAAKRLMAADHLADVSLRKKEKPYVVQLFYRLSEEEYEMSKGRKDQTALVNAAALMGLFEDIDTVIVKIARGTEIYENVLCRADMEEYFGFTIKEINDAKTFESLAGVFLDMDKVNSYLNRAHPYDNSLGKDAEKYFKCYFSGSQQAAIRLPEGESEEEKALRKKYGDALFIKGLSYDNPSINYYSAYQLLNSYDPKNLEEILVELVACRNSSSHEVVRSACERVKEILCWKDKEKTLLFTDYEETGGGSKLYGIIKGEKVQLAQWQGKTEGRIEKIALSTGDGYVLCTVETADNNLIFSLPVQRNGGYILNEEGASLNGKTVSKELTALASKNASENLKEIEASWMEGPFVKLTNRLATYVYDSVQQRLMTEQLFDENFDKQQLIEGLKAGHEVEKTTEKMDTKTSSTYIELQVEGEMLRLYEFSSRQQRNKVLNDEENVFITGRHIWNKGRMTAAYDGSDQAVVHLMSKLMQ